MLRSIFRLHILLGRTPDGPWKMLWYWFQVPGLTRGVNFCLFVLECRTVIGLLFLSLSPCTLPPSFSHSLPGDFLSCQGLQTCKFHFTATESYLDTVWPLVRIWPWAVQVWSPATVLGSLCTVTWTICFIALHVVPYSPVVMSSWKKMVQWDSEVMLFFKKIHFIYLKGRIKDLPLLLPSPDDNNLPMKNRSFSEIPHVGSGYRIPSLWAFFPGTLGKNWSPCGIVTLIVGGSLAHLHHNAAPEVTLS